MFTSAIDVPAVRRIKRYGWIPDLPDRRDRLFTAPAHLVLPPRVDLRSGCPPVYDQGELGSCTAHAIAGAVEFVMRRQQVPDAFTPSRLFIYYNERVIEGTVDEDAGAMLRDGIKSVARQGAPHERLWPYDIARFRVRPTSPAYRDGLSHQALLYRRIAQTLDQLKGCLASGFPFVFGFAVYESFESKDVTRSGEVPLPGPGEALLGGHAVLAVGYDDGRSTFLIRNSWGETWGERGYGTMPYVYLRDPHLSDDFWVITLVEDGPRGVPRCAPRPLGFRASNGG
ncbi:MAG TPA: C1 family peptidase [Vicinamibacterales bacterium]|jgi:C1A family cysteine protease|nr:C1 family peptidase [Vicinamibacterales bacterium]